MTPPYLLLAVILTTLSTPSLQAAPLAQASPSQAPFTQPPSTQPAPSQPDAQSPATSSPILPQPTPPALTLDLLLDHLQANVLEYYSSIPSFFCSEHVVSENDRPYFAHDSARTVTDSRFRLRRKVNEAHAVSLEESRVIDTIDGKPARPRADGADAIGGPSLLFGGFSESIKLASALGRACYSYRLEPPRPGHEADPLLLLFTNLPRKSRAPTCSAYSDIRGQAVIDPTLLRVVRIQQTTRDYEIVPGIIGTWTWTVDFSRVLMGGKPFWLPNKTESVALADRSFARWRYTATYTNCHKLEVTTTMLPFDTPTPTQTPPPPPRP